VPTGIAEEVFAFVALTPARAVLDAAAGLAGESARARVQAGVEVSAFAAASGQAAAPINAGQIHLDAGAAVTGPGWARRDQKGQRDNTHLQTTTH
jgi:hypothetical protein